MSANLDHIDLNSDVVLVEPENDVHGSESRVGFSDVETLTSPINDQVPAQEPLVEEARDLEVANDSKEIVVDGLGSEGFERTTESVDRGIDLEAEIGSVDDRSDAKTGVFDVSTREVSEAKATETETLSGKVEENALHQVEEEEEEVNEGTCVEMTSGSGFEDAIQVQNVGASGIVNVEVKAVANNDISVELTSDGLENQPMEIDEQAKTSEGQSAGTNVSDAGVLQEDDNNNSNVLNLVVDLKPYASMDGNVTSDLNEKAAAARAEFSVSDLVWGKVRSHPWWPGQIFDLSDASEKAKKYFRKDGYLIAYFGDQTFAWNEASKIKPFQPHFSQMVKQSNLEDFHYAVHCALDEVSRRVEFGLACPCVPEYSKIRTQIIVNAGIQEESTRRDGGDNFLCAVSFESAKLVKYVKELGEFPFSGVDRLEFVTAQAQLLAFNRWKGYSHLPEFQIHSALFESDAEIPLPVEVRHENEVNENTDTNTKDDEHVSSGKEKSKSKDCSSRKRKQISGDRMYPSKKEKSLAELMAERRALVANGKSGLDKATGKLNSSSGKKQKAVESIYDDSVLKHSKNFLTSGGDSNSSQPKRTFGVGDSILRVASQLNGPTPMLKTFNGASQKTAVKNKSQEKSVSQKSLGKMLFPIEDSSPDEMVTQLCLVANEPMKGCSFLKSLVSFFVEFRNSVCLDHRSSQQPKKRFLERVSSANIGKQLTESETGTSKSEHMKDSFWTDMIIQKDHSSLESQNEAGELSSQTPTEEAIHATEPQSAVQGSSDLDSKQQTAGVILDLGAVKPIDHLEEDCNGDPSPTALILNFTDLDSVPSEAHLNKIFSRFGPLKESETEVLQKSSRAKVVFCKRADAEVAFSSAGKYSIFGPSLVSYRLKYTTSTPSKSSPKTTKRCRRDATSVEGNAT